MTDDDTPKIIVLLDGQVTDLKAQLEKANNEINKLLDFADRLQKQNETLMLPASQTKRNWWQRLTGR